MKADESMLGVLGRTLRWNAVTIAGKPGPDPLAAHRRSELCWLSMRMSSPSAVTASMATTCSQAHPQFCGLSAQSVQLNVQYPTHLTVPTHPTLQQEASQSYIWAMATTEHEVALDEIVIEHTASGTRGYLDHHRLLI